MPYKEREGQSKLKIWKDGIRFLSIILKMVFLYQPQRLLVASAIIFFISGLLLMVSPILHYLSYKEVEEDMIYRFLVSATFGFFFALLISASYLTEKIVKITLTNHFDSSPNRSLLYKFFNSNGLWIVAVLFLAVGLFLISGSIIERISTGHTSTHWSRYVVSIFCFSASGIFMVTKAIDAILGLVSERLSFMLSSRL
jgi:hypothetical protein